jgi:hypothetical protein
MFYFLAEKSAGDGAAAMVELISVTSKKMEVSAWGERVGGLRVMGDDAVGVGDALVRWRWSQSQLGYLIEVTPHIITEKDTNTCLVHTSLP